jgi:hypothetical protein
MPQKQKGKKRLPRLVNGAVTSPENSELCAGFVVKYSKKKCPENGKS